MMCGYLVTYAQTGELFARLDQINIVEDQLDNWSNCWIDYDCDGYEDLFIPSYNMEQNSVLYKNLGDGSFEKITDNNLVNDEVNSVVASWADYNNDLRTDVLIANNSGQSDLLYTNICGGSFSLTSDLEIFTDGGFSHGASWADYDNDGWLDVFISDYAKANRNRLYKNNADGTFEKVYDENISSILCASIGAVWGDLNNDGYPDLVVPNNEEENVFFINQQDGSFNKAILNEIGNSVGCSLGDYDNDGDLDLFFANSSGQDNFLYENDGTGSFTQVTDSVVSTDGGHSHGSTFSDFNNDGHLDLLVSNDRDGPSYLYINQGDGSFEKNTTDPIVNTIGQSFGVGACDYDKDGDQDIYISNHSNEENFFYQNQTTDQNWSAIQLRGVNCNANAIGAKIRLKATINGESFWQLREINSQSGGGAGSQSSFTAHFGLGDATQIDSLVIEWSPQYTQSFSDIEANEYLYIIEEQDYEFGLLKNDSYYNCADLEGFETEEGTLSICPNPTQGQFTIKTIESETIIGKIVIFDAKGALMNFYENVEIIGSYTLDIDRYSPGMYIIIIQANDGRRFQAKVVTI